MALAAFATRLTGARKAGRVKVRFKSWTRVSSGSGSAPMALAASATRLKGAREATPRSVDSAKRNGSSAATHKFAGCPVKLARFSFMNTRYAVQNPATKTHDHPC